MSAIQWQTLRQQIKKGALKTAANHYQRIIQEENSLTYLARGAIYSTQEDEGNHPV
jgi:hypothetical protein